MITFIRRLLQDEHATTSVEYAVVLAMIVISAYAGVSMFGSEAGSLFSDSSDQISSKMGSGGGS